MERWAAACHQRHDPRQPADRLHKPVDDLWENRPIATQELDQSPDGGDVRQQQTGKTNCQDRLQEAWL